MCAIAPLEGELFTCGLGAYPFGTEQGEQPYGQGGGEDQAHVYDQAVVGARTQDGFVLRRPGAGQQGLADSARPLVELQGRRRKEEKGKASAPAPSTSEKKTFPSDNIKRAVLGTPR